MAPSAPLGSASAVGRSKNSIEIVKLSFLYDFRTRGPKEKFSEEIREIFQNFSKSFFFFEFSENFFQ